MIKIIRHAFALIREDKLFSTIYVAGTAVAIASAMVVAIFLNIKLADISIPFSASSPSRWLKMVASSTCATLLPPSTRASDG